MSTEITEAKVLIDDAIYTESPRWHDGALWFSDIGGHQVRRVRLDGRSEVVVSSIETPSGLGWTQSGDLLVVSITASAIYRVGRDGVAEVFCGHDRHGVPGANDMATAGSRSYVTCSGRHYQDGDDLAALSQPVGKILLLDHHSGEARVVADGMKMPNGVAITSDGKTLVVAEVYASRILAFEILADGSLSPPRVMRALNHAIDGLCLDTDGGVWLGGTGETFERLDANGEVTATVRAPGWKCIAPMLGGPDGRTLFMAASQFNGADDIFQQRARGAILFASVSTPAAAEATFS